MPRHINDDFEAPSTSWAIATVVAGIATGLGLIIGLEYLSNRISSKNSSLSDLVIVLEGRPLPQKQALDNY